MLLVIAAVMFHLERIMCFRLLTQTRVGLGLVVWVNTGVEDSWSVQFEMQAYSLGESQDLHGVNATQPHQVHPLIPFLRQSSDVRTDASETAGKGRGTCYTGNPRRLTTFSVGSLGKDVFNSDVPVEVN